jgi:hypothetical protein
MPYKLPLYGLWLRPNVEGEFYALPLLHHHLSRVPLGVSGHLQEINPRL